LAKPSIWGEERQRELELQNKKFTRLEWSNLTIVLGLIDIFGLVPGLVPGGVVVGVHLRIVM